MDIVHRMSRRRWLRPIVLFVLLAAVGACESGSSRRATDRGPSTEQPVPYTRVGASEEVRVALGEASMRHAQSGRALDEFGLVVSPQPSHLASGTVLVAVQYGDCGGRPELGPAFVKEGVLRVQLVESALPPGVTCGGVANMAALEMVLPRGATVSTVVVERREREQG